MAGVTKFDIIKTIGKQMGKYFSETETALEKIWLIKDVMNLLVTNGGNIVACRNN